jgi:hypothetical protein
VSLVATAADHHRPTCETASFYEHRLLEYRGTDIVHRASVSCFSVHRDRSALRQSDGDSGRFNCVPGLRLSSERRRGRAAKGKDERSRARHGPQRKTTTTTTTRLEPVMKSMLIPAALCQQPSIEDTKMQSQRNRISRIAPLMWSVITLFAAHLVPAEDDPVAKTRTSSSSTELGRMAQVGRSSFRCWNAEGST